MREQRLFYCYRCGGKLEKQAVPEPRLVCCKCGTISYENPIVGVAGMVFDDKGRILLVRRGSGIDYENFWCIPCGYVEYDEDIRLAVVRELQEETGLVIKAGEVFAVHSNFHNSKQHTVGVWFLCSVISGQPVAGDDADMVDWFYPKNTPPLAFPTDEIVLADWLDKINKKIDSAL